MVTVACRKQSLWGPWGSQVLGIKTWDFVLMEPKAWKNWKGNNISHDSRLVSVMARKQTVFHPWKQPLMFHLPEHSPTHPSPIYCHSPVPQARGKAALGRFCPEAFPGPRIMKQNQLAGNPPFFCRTSATLSCCPICPPFFFLSRSKQFGSSTSHAWNSFQ